MASGKGSTCISDLLDLFFQNTSLSWAGNADLYVSLHTANPSASGAQNTSEANYTSYARQPVVRTSSGWTVSSGVVSNAAAINFPSATGGSSTVTYVGIGTALTGAGELLYFGALNSSLAVSSGVQPIFPVGALQIAET